ncbi:Multiple RNA-binding domain-containing protein 1 [Ceratocystis pirilliformis]|uniref:Multiple RNA-binding domain-containing protein 1 n=1 Tax=Ceratocystis pirilliformis TaxID=259994 RepID=A0ABR3Z0H6_9PEZI
MSNPPNSVDSSRIFVRGLPPNITESDLRKHFSSNSSDVTDVKIIPQRRIGYVGFKTPEDALSSVRYFNRSYMRMSKLGVELAKPINDPSLKRRINRATNTTNTESNTLAASKAHDFVLGTSEAKKRKRVEAVDPTASDSKLREFISVMQSSKGGLETPDFGVDIETKATKQLLREDASDDEYEKIPSRPPKRQATEPQPVRQTAAVSIQTTSNASGEVKGSGEGMEVDAETKASVPLSAEATQAINDDDWLRSRTNRMLDLVDVEDIKPLAPSKDVTEPNADHSEAVPSMETTVVADPSPQECTAKPAREKPATEQDTDEATIRQTCRIFVRNLSYETKEENLREYFEKFGAVEEVHIPTTAAGKSKGFALIRFTDPEVAVAAFQRSDGVSFQGRLIHILPAAPKREGEIDEFALAKLPLKQQALIRKRAEAASNTFNWNSLYMNQDAVVSSMAQRLGVSKAELLDPTSSDAAVKKAIAETTVIQETKAYFMANGVNIDAFKQQKRGDTAILVKNFSFNTTIEELRNMFAEHGTVIKVLMPPSGTIAIVQMASPAHAKAAFARLAYRRVNESVLFLEKAPVNLLVNDDNATAAATTMEPTQGITKLGVQKLSVTQLLTEASEEAEESAQANTTSLFVGNLSFATNTEGLEITFRSQDGFVSARVKTKQDPKKPGKVLSMGFGFVEFKTKEQAQAALKALEGYNLDGHSLALKASHRGLDAAEERRRDDKAKKLHGQRTKIVIKNLPFEASKKDIRNLFSTYGQLRSIRLPKKFNHTSRGFAFADFVTAREAENALNALRDTHLLGRKLVLDFAEADAVDAEEEIEKMQRKVGSQVNKVKLQQLTNRDRTRVTIGDEGQDE